MDCDYSLLSFVGEYSHPHTAGPNVKNEGRRIALGIDDLTTLIFRCGLSSIYPGEDVPPAPPIRPCPDPSALGQKRPSSRRPGRQGRQLERKKERLAAVPHNRCKPGA